MHVATDDFALFCREIGVPLESMHAMKALEMELLMDDFPDRVRYGRSVIDGVGAFSNYEIAAEDVINPAFRDGCWTMLGRYTNHSPEPNCKAEARDGIVYFIAKTQIRPLDEITVDYRNVRKCINEIKI